MKEVNISPETIKIVQLTLKRLKKQMNNSNLKQCDIAETLGISTSSISYKLDGQRSISLTMFCEIAKRAGFKEIVIKLG